MNYELAWRRFCRKYNHAASEQLDQKYDGQPRDDRGRFDFGKRPTAEQQEEVRVAARVSPALEAFCERQYDKDVFQCKMVGLPACYAQAALRYANCLKGLPIPPLNY